MIVDLERERSPAAVQRAIKGYGEKLTDPTYHAFAKLVADGLSATKAYRRLFPQSSQNTARVQASVLLGHPDMPGMIRDHIIGARNMAESLTPSALRHLHELAYTADKNSKPQIDAVNSLLDRGGLPRAKELSVSVSVSASQARGAFDGDVIDVQPLELEEQPAPGDLPAHDQLLIGDGGADELDVARAQWAKLLPVDALRSVGSVADDGAGLEADDDDDDRDANADA